MKLKDVLSKVSENKTNKQKTACFKKKALNKIGMSVDELLEIKLDSLMK